MVGGVLEANKRWDIGKEVINYISKDYPGVQAIRPTVRIFHIHLCSSYLKNYLLFFSSKILLFA